MLLHSKIPIYKKPLVSVIIPTYNHRLFVRAAIDSVLNQSITNIEVIIIDDSSNDGTQEVLNSIKDNRIRLIKLAENRQAHSRNLGIKYARGNYIAFQNSDDIWLKNKLKLQLECFDKNKKLAAVFTKITIINKAGNITKTSWAKNLFSTTNRSRAEWLKTFFDTGNCLCISSAMVSKKHLTKAGRFDESLTQLSDFDMWIRLASVGDFYIINKPLTKMRIVTNKNASAPTSKNIRRSGMELAQVLERFTRKDSLVKLHQVFPEIIGENYPELVQKATLAIYAWNKTPYHKLYADRLFSSLVSNTKQRQEITEYFGVKIYKEFIEKRSELEIVAHD